MPWIDEQIETDRLRLRLFRDSDKPAIIALATQPDVRRYLGGPMPAEQVDEIRRATVGERWGSFCVADRASDTAIGAISFGRERGVLELSYQMLPARWGQGLATEAAAAALSWAWMNTDDRSIIAVTQRANTASLRLLGRLGFVEAREFDEFDAQQVELRLERPADAGAED